jgi:OOP family OmpA-OmpF porin
MKFKGNLLFSSVALAALLVTGCSEFDIRELNSTPREGYPFSRALANEYEILAKKLHNKYTDEIDASHFAVKGIQAASGETPLPEDPRSWSIPDSHRSGLQEARNRLIFALEKSGVKGGHHIAPQVAAEAQVAFDCLVEEKSESWERPELSTCEKLFKDRLIQLEKMVAEQAPTFKVQFGFNSHVLSADATRMLDEVAKVAKNLDLHVVNVIGNTDHVGGRKHNLTLSQRRAEGVRNYLVKKGIDSRRIIAFGAGEKEGAEVAPQNRNVVVQIH